MTKISTSPNVSSIQHAEKIIALDRDLEAE